MIYKYYYVKGGLAIRSYTFDHELELEKYSNFRFSEDGVTYHYKYTIIDEEEEATKYFYLEDQELTDYWEEVMAKKHDSFKRK